MPITSPRLRRLDDALAYLPAESEAMLLSELDGYVAGVIVCPEPIPPAEWLPPIWGSIDEAPPFEDEREARWYGDLAVQHRDAVVATLAKGAGRYKPFFEIDPRHDEVMWELWIEGFAMAMDLRPDAWPHFAKSDEPGVTEAFVGMTTLIEIARDESSLERETIDALTEEAPTLIPGWIEALHGLRSAPAILEASSPTKVGRNDPCLCGSGRKHKKCCGAG